MRAAVAPSCAVSPTPLESAASLRRASARRARSYASRSAAIPPPSAAGPRSARVDANAAKLALRKTREKQHVRFRGSRPPGRPGRTRTAPGARERPSDAGRARGDPARLQHTKALGNRGTGTVGCQRRPRRTIASVPSQKSLAKTLVPVASKSAPTTYPGQVAGGERPFASRGSSSGVVASKITGVRTAGAVEHERHRARRLSRVFRVARGLTA